MSGQGKAPIVLDDSAEESDGTLRHYTQHQYADSILEQGLAPGADGFNYLIKDEDTSGVDAKTYLALRETPDGYFEFPEGRIPFMSSPGPVDPLNDEPAGGTEIKGPPTIDMSCLEFRGFDG